MCAAAAIASAASILPSQNDAQDVQRLITAMALEPRMTVAEIGAGAGELTVLMARHLGTQGRVYSTEISQDRLAAIKNAITAASLSNVIVLEAGVQSTNLPAECCDAIFMRVVYHHFSNPNAINASLFTALKPGGRLAILDFPPLKGREAVTAEGRASGDTHGVTKETVARELTAAGLEVLRAEEPRAGQQGFIVVARKPADVSECFRDNCGQ
jgi:tRNA A58 N-methylase Trm61